MVQRVIRAKTPSLDATIAEIKLVSNSNLRKRKFNKGVALICIIDLKLFEN